MKVESLKISKVFSGGGEVHYILPHFQREYAWEKANWQTLLDDIYAIYEIYDEHHEPEHFMGALVVIGDGNRSGTIPVFKLVDGQQRLTTISIALCALAALVQESHPRIYTKIHKMLVNDGETGDVRYKLLPTEKYDDRNTFKAIIDGKHVSLNGDTQSRIKDAYFYLGRQLEKWLRDGIDPERLFLVFANCLQVVFIDLDKRERPFEIFESLNAKGKPLTQPDLVRNYIAMMLPENSQNNAFDAWIDIENRLRENRTVSRIGELTAFLRHYLAYRSGLLPNKGHVYARFRDRVHRELLDNDEDFVLELEALQRFALYYDRFIRPENEPDHLIRNQLQRLEVIESVTAYPFLLGLFDEYLYHRRINRDQLIEVLSLIENYIIRRFLANEPANYINKMFPALWREVSPSNIVDSVKEALVKRNYPTDTRIRAALPELSLYTNLNRLRLIFILTNVNQFLSQGSDGYTVLRDEPTIEHIMPQTLTASWRYDLGQDSDEVHRDLLHTIGNLTLVTQTWNAALSNGDWNSKRSKLAAHALRINQVYFSNTLTIWDQDAIHQRAEWLIDLVLQIWPSFGTPPATDTYTGSTPQHLVISGEYIDVTSWRDVIWKTMEYAITNVDNFDNFAATLQTTYLTTEQRSRAKQLSNGWWLYISLSSQTVMTLCGRVFQQLGLQEEDWDVKLRTV
ncbi:MAG: DUF262 and DUF1524 domain-containing protein [Anaerolineae bacterium]